MLGQNCIGTSVSPAKSSRDLCIWKKFITEYGGWTPIITPTTPVIYLFTNTATIRDLGWGAWWGTAWIWDQWDPEFMQSNNPSINFLELFAVVVVLQVWSPQFANKHVVVRSDNQPTVAVINAKTSNNTSMLILIHYLTLHYMLNNIKVTTQFVPGCKNSAADTLHFLAFSFPDSTPSCQGQTMPKHTYPATLPAYQTSAARSLVNQSV